MKKTTQNSNSRKKMSKDAVQPVETTEVTEPVQTDEAPASTEEQTEPVEATDAETPQSEHVEPVQAEASEPVETVEAEAAQTEPEATEPVTTEPTEPVQADETPKADKPVRPTSERYEAACAEVSKTNKEFLAALDKKAALLGTERKNESVGVYSHPDIAKLDERIKETRARLDSLLEEKRRLKTQAEGLAEVDERVSYWRKQRNLARDEKKAAAAELGI